MSAPALDLLLASPADRPPLDPITIASVVSRLHRTHTGYCPTSGDELVDLLTERLLIPQPEWESLLAARTVEQAESDESVLLEAVGSRGLWIRMPGSLVPAMVARSRLPHILRTFTLDWADIHASAASGNEPPQAITTDTIKTGPDHIRQVDRIISEWLRFYGPVQADALLPWGLEPARSREILERLTADGDLLNRIRIKGLEEEHWCDAANYERLLRTARAAKRSRNPALPITSLPAFLARHHGLSDRGHGIDGLRRCLEQLFGWISPASTWESELIPARIPGYHPAWLDSLLQNSDLIWYGIAAEKIGFCFRDMVNIFLPGQEYGPGGHELDDRILALFPDPSIHYDFFTIQRMTGLDSSILTSLLWNLAWRAQITNDSMASLRQGLANGFVAQPTIPGDGRPNIHGWQSSRPLMGTWSRVSTTFMRDSDPLQEMDNNRRRVRQLVARHGILFRELLSAEPEAFTWGRLLPAMRLMELSGELIAGSFFEEIPGLQFVGAAFAGTIARSVTPNAIFWLCATDPASCCGLGINGLRDELPSRINSTHLVYRGDRLCIISKRMGRQLEFRIAPDDPMLAHCLQPIKEWLQRDASPLRHIEVESINNQPPIGSPFEEALRAFGFVRGPRYLSLRRSY